MLKNLVNKLSEMKKGFEENHGILAYSVEFVISVALTFSSSFIAAKLTRQAIDRIAKGRELSKVTSFILSVLIGFIPAFIGSFISTMTMPNERILKVGIINKERDRRDKLLVDISDEELFSDETCCTNEREEA